MSNRLLVRIIIIAIMVAAAAVAATIIISNRDSIFGSGDEMSDQLMDEISRAKCFIVDWYNELSSGQKCSVFLNEMRFQGGKHSLTYAGRRLRALYPRGERFFKLEQITKVEFFEVDGVIRCRFSYGENGEYMFRIS